MELKTWEKHQEDPRFKTLTPTGQHVLHLLSGHRSKPVTLPSSLSMNFKKLSGGYTKTQARKKRKLMTVEESVKATLNKRKR